MGQDKKTPTKGAVAKRGRPSKSAVATTAAPDINAVAQDDDNYLRAKSAVAAINAALPKGGRELAPIPDDYVFRARDRKAVEVALHAAFELIGGVPRLIQWGADNQTKFYELYARMLPPAQEAQPQALSINFHSAVPASPLDNITVNEDGTVLDISDADDIPE